MINHLLDFSSVKLKSGQFIHVGGRGSGRTYASYSHIKDCLEAGGTVGFIGNLNLPQLEKFCNFEIDCQNAEILDEIIRDTFILKRKEDFFSEKLKDANTFLEKAGVPKE